MYSKYVADIRSEGCVNYSLLYANIAQEMMTENNIYLLIFKLWIQVALTWDN
jgi:hypothetical protein